MKKCPNCQKTFDDNMKFCQTDGTPLVVVADNTPAADPYATMVANKGDLPIPPEEPKKEAEEVKVEPKDEPKVEADPYATIVSGGPSAPEIDPEGDGDDLLEVPGHEKDEEVDPMKTMVVSGNTADNIRVDIPEEKSKDEPVRPPVREPKKEDASEAQTILSPDIPKFNEPEIAAPPDMGDSTPKPKAKPDPPKSEPPAKTPGSPFDSGKPNESKQAPIPSPFDESMPPGFPTPSNPPFEPPKEPLKPEPLNTPNNKQTPKSTFADPAKPVVESNTEGWKPQTTPKAGDFGNQGIANQSFDSSIPSQTSASDGQNQTLAFVSLGLGIVSYVCMLGPVSGLIAIITGYMARKNIRENPNEYGGGTFALIGMILGAIAVLLTLIIIGAWLFLVILNS